MTENLSLIYITDIDINASNHKGVRNKIFGQIQAFRANAFDVHFFYRSGNKIIAEHKDGQRTVKVLSDSRLRSIAQRQKFFSYISSEVQNIHPSYLYIRYPMSNKHLYSFLKEISAKTIIELPTYPYTQEFNTGLKNQLILKLDKKWRKKVSNHVDLYLTIGEEAESIDGVKSVSMVNGFYWNHDIPAIKTEIKKPYQVVFIGNPMAHHGIEYFKHFASISKDVLQFHIVGSSKLLFNEIGEVVPDNFTFYDFMEEVELSHFLSKMDFAVSTLAPQVRKHSPLKSRIYTLHGLPFIYAGNDNDFEGKSFAYKLDNLSGLSSNKLIEIFDSLAKENRQKIQDYSLTDLTWEKKMKSVIHYLKN